MSLKKNFIVFYYDNRGKIFAFYNYYIFIGTHEYAWNMSMVSSLFKNISFHLFFLLYNLCLNFSRQYPTKMNSLPNPAMLCSFYLYVSIQKHQQHEKNRNTLRAAKRTERNTDFVHLSLIIICSVENQQAYFKCVHSYHLRIGVVNHQKIFYGIFNISLSSHTLRKKPLIM